jgi:hypothetical protein
MAKTFKDEVKEAIEYIKSKPASAINEVVEDKDSLEIIVGLIAIVAGIKDEPFTIKQDITVKDKIYVSFEHNGASKFVAQTLVSMVDSAKHTTLVTDTPNTFIAFMKNITAKENKKFFGLGKSSLEITF